MSLGRRQALVLAVLGALAACEDRSRAPPAVLPPLSAAGPVRANVQKVEGGVKVKRAAGDDWIAAAEQMGLRENDKLRTGPGASARLEFINGSLVTIGEDALITIAEQRSGPGADRSDVTLLKGRVDAELDRGENRSLTVATPAATIRAGREIVFQ